jgi:hypothetical protein
VSCDGKRFARDLVASRVMEPSERRAVIAALNNLAYYVEQAIRSNGLTPRREGEEPRPPPTPLQLHTHSLAFSGETLMLQSQGAHDNRFMIGSILRFPDKKATQADQRAFHRSPIGLKTNVIAVGGKDLPGPVRIALEDISGGGVRLRTKRPFDTGEHVNITFALPGEQWVNDAVVEVLACDPAVEGFIVRCTFVELRMGGQFLDWVLSRLTQMR